MFYILAENSWQVPITLNHQRMADAKQNAGEDMQIQMREVKLKTTGLWGGYMLIDVPEGFVDVSNKRQIPETQEVIFQRSFKKRSYSLIVTKFCFFSRSRSYFLQSTEIPWAPENSKSWRKFWVEKSLEISSSGLSHNQKKLANDIIKQHKSILTFVLKT